MKNLTHFKIEPKETIANAVAEKLVDYIAKNNLEEGDKLPSERELIKIIGVSRLVLREGLSMLKGIGLIDAHHGKGIFVKRVNLNAIFNLLAPVMEVQANMKIDNAMQVRSCIEPYIASLAAENRTENNLTSLKKTLTAMEEALKDQERFINLDMKFHRTIASSTQNKIFLLFTHTLHDLLSNLNHKFPSLLKNRKVILSYNQKIFEAVKDKDSVRAEKHIREQIAEIWQK
ncbi:MAG: FadR/GntR family transcriptional regulator [Planctomycetota bacterium]|jgi:DNA-binding FadR family transcriptional regulator